jgi:SNF2 family DNA or RNA helicase
LLGRSKAAALPPTTAKRSRTNENATPSVSSAPIQILPESTSKRICVEECQMPAKTSQMMSSSPGIIALASAPAISSSVMMQLKNPGAVVINQNYRSTREFPIIIDAHIARHLRPHQIDGVNFMYNCLMGLTNPNFNGAILADEMGLGKTLQAIAIIWTMLKTGPQGHPCISKAIIICPTTLVANWQNELVKWLGTVRLAPLTLVSGSKLEEQQTTLTRFLQSNANPVLITSYEMYRKKSELICNALLASNKKMSTTQLALSGIVICDEGHRLKNSGGNQTIKALNLLPWKRR